MSTTSAVELLRDGRGIYGIGVSDVFDFEALAWTCGIDPRDTWQTAHVQNLMLRPDMLRFSTKHKLSFAVLQKITGGLRDGMFSNSHEEQLRRLIHHEALIRAGLPWPPSPPSPERRIKYWSSDKKQQDRNRQIYHGLRRRSLAVINKLIGLALQEATDLDALKMARRFAFYYREPMYRAAARSRRALQLADAFPILALAVYSSAAHDWLLEPDGYSPDCYSIDHIQAKAKAATDMVERGVRLRDIAAVMQIPMALRRVKPGAAHLARARHNAEWVMSCMPGSLPRMRTWLRAVHRAHLRGGSEFADWAAKHALQIPVGSENELLSFLHDLSDWVRASRGNDGHQFVVRPFKPTMSLRTVTKLSAEWHEAVASNMTGPQLTFPAPWFPAATINDVNIIPIDNSADLYREGATMHHCVGTYAEEVRAGRFYVYSIRREGEHVATASLIRDGSSAQLHELRGPCNSPVPKQISVLVGRWLRSHTPRWGHEVATAGRSKPDDT
jgi:PcfJ-like protein